MSLVEDSLKDEFIGTRATLLSRLKNVDDNRSWAEFYDLYWKLIRNIATRSGMTPEEAQEVVQEVFLDLVRKLPEFKYKREHGSFKKFLKMLVHWRVRDQYRKRLHLLALEELEETDPLSTDDPLTASPGPIDDIWETEWRENLLEAAKERTRAKVDPRLYQIFDLATSRGMSSSEISKLLNVSRTSVYLAKHRVFLIIRSQLRRLKSKFEKNLSPGQKESF